MLNEKAAGEPRHVGGLREAPASDLRLGETPPARGAVVFLAREGAEHLVVRAVLEHEHDNVLDLAAERRAGDAAGPRALHCTGRSAPGDRRRGGGGSELEEPASGDRHGKRAGATRKPGEPPRDTGRLSPPGT
jgi:hypothetical protein